MDVPTDSPEETNSNAWLTPRRFAALLALLVFAAYPQVILGLQTFVYRDFGYYAYPLAYYFRESFWQGDVPLWNPLSYCGIPFLAQWNTQALYPPALFYLLFPLSWSLAVFCVLHLFIGGLGMFFLAQRTGNQFAAAFAAVAYAFNGLMLNSTMWPGTIPGFAWMPWVLWIGERAWREGGRSVIWAALAGALQMLSGAAEVILMTWILAGALAVSDFVRNKAPRGKILLRFAAVVLLITGLCAAQLLPFFQLINESDRQGSFFRDLWPMPLHGWGNFFVPLFHAARAPHGMYLQYDQYWTNSYYVGVITLMLAVWALISVRRARIWIFGALTLLCLVLAWGNKTILYRWLVEHIGAFSLMRYPVKYVILPVFTLPLLGGFALARIQSAYTDEHSRARRRIFWGMWLAGIVLIAYVVVISKIFPRAYDDWPATWKNGLARGLFFSVIIAGMLCLEKVRQLKTRRLLQIGVLLLVWLDLMKHVPQPQTIAGAMYTPVLPRSWQAPHHGEARAMNTQEARATLSRSMIPDPTSDYMSRRYALFSNCNLLEGIPKPDGFFPLQIGNYVPIFHILFSQTNAPPENLMKFVGVRHITAPNDVFDWVARTNYLPMITGGQKPVIATADAILKELADTNFSPGEVVYLLPEAESLLSATNAAVVKISGQNFSAHQIECDVEAEDTALLVIAQTHFPNWRAYVNGRETRVLRANYAFQAIEIPAGNHRITLRYVDKRFVTGSVISIGTLVLCAGALIRMRRKSTATPSPA